VNNNIKDKA